MGQPILVKSLMAIIAIICAHAEHVSCLVGLDGIPWDSRGLLVACNLNDVSVLRLAGVQLYVFQVTSYLQCYYNRASVLEAHRPGR
jgi:hypothetical protein